MRYNTLITYPMTAKYRSWEPSVATDGLTYRAYAEAQTIKCSLSMLSTGTMFIATPEKLQLFGILYDITDPAGTPVMDEVWYSIQGATPVFDAAAHVSSYRHRIALLAASLIGSPIDPPQEYPDLDQA